MVNLETFRWGLIQLCKWWRGQHMGIAQEHGSQEMMVKLMYERMVILGKAQPASHRTARDGNAAGVLSYIQSRASKRRVLAYGRAKAFQKELVDLPHLVCVK
jgi:hypothetical protein